MLRISADIRQAEGWDETAIVERGARLAALATEIWSRPATPADEQIVEQDLRAVVGPSVDAASSIEPLPDEEDFASVLKVADTHGVGAEMRRLVSGSRALGLYPRPFRRSVMVSPPADKRAYLFTVWPQSAEGGSFRLWPSIEAFMRYYPTIELNDALAELGDEEGPRTLMPADVDRLLASVRRLVGPGATGATEVEVEGTATDGIPAEIDWLIAMRATADAARVARRFAHEALAMDGVNSVSRAGRASLPTSRSAIRGSHRSWPTRMCDRGASPSNIGSQATIRRTESPKPVTTSTASACASEMTNK